jgi:Rieske Fe-S protein
MNLNALSRRKFIKKSGGLITWTLSIKVLNSSCKNSSTSNIDNSQNRNNNIYRIDLNDSSNAVLQSINGAKKFSNVPGQSKPVIIIRISQNEVVALSSECTHQGCEVNLPSSAKITCPCHNSQFNLQGNNIKGPATIPLSNIETKFEQEEIILILS